MLHTHWSVFFSLSAHNGIGTSTCSVNVCQTVETGCLMIPPLSSPSFLLSDLLLSPSSPVESPWGEAHNHFHGTIPSILCHYSLYHPPFICFHPSQVILSWQFSFMLQQRSQETERGMKPNNHRHLPFDWLSTHHGITAVAAEEPNCCQCSHINSIQAWDKQDVSLSSVERMVRD